MSNMLIQIIKHGLRVVLYVMTCTLQHLRLLPFTPSLVPTIASSDGIHLRRSKQIQERNQQKSDNKNEQALDPPLENHQQPMELPMETLVDSVNQVPLSSEHLYVVKENLYPTQYKQHQHCNVISRSCFSIIVAYYIQLQQAQ